MAIVQLRQIEIYTKLVSIPYQIQYYSDKMMRSVVDKDRTTLALVLDSNQKVVILLSNYREILDSKGTSTDVTKFQVKIDDKGVGYRIIK